MKTSWSNVAGQFSIEVYLDGDVVRDTDDKELKPLEGIVKLDDALELVIDFRSSGYHESASMYGGPDNLGWPEDYADERLLESAYLTDGKTETKLTQAQQDQLFALYSDQIDEVEVEADNDGPEYEREDD